VLIPRVGANLGKFEKLALLKRARSAGFDYVVDLTDSYDDYRAEDLALAPGDYHPNPKGHAILADALTRSLAQWPDLRTRLEAATEQRR